MADGDAPHHAHVYYSPGEREAAGALRETFKRLAAAGGGPPILFVGAMAEQGVGPHPIPQYEVHFRERALADVVEAIESSGLRALVHPLTDDDMADHSALAQWIGEPVALDLAVLDPPGRNQGIARFGKSDF
jgi:DOPA 4,5-dioxygenase